MPHPQSNSTSAIASAEPVTAKAQLESSSEVPAELPAEHAPEESGECSAGECSQPEYSEPEYSEEERGVLLRLAHDSIGSVLQSRELSLNSPTAHLGEARGAFTSLYLDDKLRGCVGYALPSCSVYRAVAETARAAAFEDNRFSPVTSDEAQHLDIELSILSRPHAIHPDAIEIGRHGLLISQNGRRGLLLPQVAIEHQWNVRTFLEQTCRKAGLAPDAWQRGATIQAFTAEVFGDK